VKILQKVLGGHFSTHIVDFLTFAYMLTSQTAFLCRPICNSYLLLIMAKSKQAWLQVV